MRRAGGIVLARYRPRRKTKPFGRMPRPIGVDSAARDGNKVNDALEKAAIGAGDGDAAELLVKARAGDVGAIKTLYARCTVVYTYVHRRYGDAVLAKEVFHDTVTEIWKGAARFDGRSKFSTWVIGIARHLAANAWRKRSATEPALEADADHDGSEDEESHHDGDAGPDPFQALMRRQQREGLLRCIRRLSPKLSETLLLVYYADMAHGDIAAMLQLNLNTVKTRVRDAHIKLKDCLGGVTA